MTPEQFRAFGWGLFGYGWQRQLAWALGVSERAVHYWAAQGPPKRRTKALIALARIVAEERSARLDKLIAELVNKVIEDGRGSGRRTPP